MRVITLVCLSFLLASVLPAAVGADHDASTPLDRYTHTRCIVLAVIPEPEGLSALSEEVGRLRALGAPEIVVVIAGATRWPESDSVHINGAPALRNSADQVLLEWRAPGPVSAWIAELGSTVPSALLEAAFWQDRGYRLLPYAPQTSLLPPPAPADAAEGTPGAAVSPAKPRFRFSW